MSGMCVCGRHDGFGEGVWWCACVAIHFEIVIERKSFVFFWSALFLFSN